MGSWFDSNLSAIQEYPFDFERYIEERLREIDDLDERRFAKTVLLEGLGKAIRCMEHKYRNLEQRVFEELEIAANQFETVITIIHRNHYDITNDTLFPICAIDLESRKLAETQSDDNYVYIGTIFLEVSEGKQRKFEASGDFPGKLNQQEAVFKICRSERYKKRIEELYRIFQDNHIPWETINTGYLDKFYDVFVEDRDIEVGKYGLKDAQIRFGEFERHVRPDMFPLWNIEWTTFDSAKFMLPCTDGIYYEHEFTLDDKKESDGYLIESNEDILEIRHEKKNIVIKSQKETFENWKALHISQQPTVKSLDYNAPLLSNHKWDSFVRRYTENSHVHLMTKTDLFRRIMELDIREYIEVVGYQICDNSRDYPVTGEGMNWFVKDELFPMESRKVLLLQFQEKQPGHYLNESMVRFVISQMQLEISEYRCVGVIL